jgi:NitT/TauT family transport system substrate-binding protein
MRNLLTAIVVCCMLTATPTKAAAPAKTYDVCWSHYTGWEPWAYADEKGLLKKWGDKYGISIRLTLVNDYVESVNLYTAGKYQACAMTNMDALTIPAVGGVDSTALIVGDFSNGNDGIVTKGGKTVKELKGQKVKLVQLSVSHYLLTRALAMNGMTEKDVTLVNTSDADIGPLFDSAKIPGEIIDMMVVRTDAPDALKKALVGAWYETMAVMSGADKQGKDAIAFMAAKAGGTVAEFEAQLKATAMFYKPAEAASFAKSPKLKETMEFVRTFSFEKGLFGQGARTKDAVGIGFPDGSVIGNPKNVKLRFDANYMQMAADGKL